MLALLAILVLTPLLYLPGYLVLHALLGYAQPSDHLERHYERTLLGVLLNGWLAFTLATLGIFSAWLHILLILLICSGAILIVRQRGGTLLPHRPLGIIARPAAAQTTRRTLLATHWEALAYAAVLIVFGAIVGRPFETILGLRDAGVYASAGFAIARTGGIAQYDSLIAQIASDQQSSDPLLREAAAHFETNALGVQHPDRHIATKRRMGGFLIHEGDLAQGRVVPQGFHMYPVWIGLLTSLLGLQGGLLATGLMGLLGVWSVGMLGRRLAGSWVGLLGSAVLALNGGQVWFSRYSTSETTFQFLCIAGLYAFAVAQADEGQGVGGRPAPSVPRSRSDGKGARSEDISDPRSPSLNSYGREATGQEPVAGSNRIGFFCRSIVASTCSGIAGQYGTGAVAADEN